MKKQNIFIAGAIIDFYVDKKKYDKLKTKLAKKRLVEKTLMKCLASIKNTTINGIEIREASINSNNFWGIDDFCFINDIGYSANNPLPPKEDVLSCRIFQIDLFGLTDKSEIISDCFFQIIKPSCILGVARVQIV